MAKYSATTAATAVDATVVKSVVEAQLPEIAKCRAATNFERTGCNNVLLSMWQQSPFLVDVPRQCSEAEKFQCVDVFSFELF